MGLLSVLTTRRQTAGFLHAIRDGRAKDLARLLDRRGNPDQSDEDGFSALALAAGAGRFDLMDLLLQSGAHVLAGDSALLEACCQGGVEAVRILYPHIPDTHTRNMLFITAAAGGYLEVVSLLVNRGTDVNSSTPQGWTALIMASMEGHLEVCRFLLERGARVNASDSGGSTALMAACQFGRFEIANLLVEHGANPNAKSLTSSVPHSRYGAAEDVLPSGMTALAWASRNGHGLIVGMLLENGATVDVRDGAGWTPLMWAALGGHSEVMTALLNSGADIACHTSSSVHGLFSAGSSALMLAAYQGRADAVELLLARGPDPDQKDTAGRTALMLAARRGHGDVVKLLIDRGARIDATDDKGVTALGYALSEQHDKVVETLRERGTAEPIITGTSLSLGRTWSLPSMARVRDRRWRTALWLAGGTLFLVATATLVIMANDFSSWSLPEKELVGGAFSVFIGFMAWLVRDPEALAVGILWVVIATLVLIGIAVEFSRRMAESGHWGVWLAGNIGRAANIGALAAGGSAVMLFTAGFMMGLPAAGGEPGLNGAYLPCYFTCTGALLLAFIHAGRERFTIKRICGLVGLLFLAGMFPVATFTGSSRDWFYDLVSFLGLNAALCIHMVLMVTLPEERTNPWRASWESVGRAILSIPTILALALVVFWVIAEAIDLGRVILKM